MMAFQQKTWKDRLAEFAGRRILTKVSGSADSQIVVDVARSEGTVSQAGDAFSAANMNDLEQRIADGIEEVNNKLVTQLPNDVKLITEGSGAGATYYVQLGADTASKKQLGRRAKLIGTITGNGSVSCAGISGYNKLNSNDFIVEITSIHVTASYHRVGTGEGASTAGTCNISKSYNSSTGLLSVSGLNYSLMAGNAANYGKAVLVCTAKVYLV